MLTKLKSIFFPTLIQTLEKQQKELTTALVRAHMSRIDLTHHIEHIMSQQSYISNYLKNPPKE
jgi:hypothetical protein